MEVDRAAAQQLARLLHDLVALDLLGADVEQAHGRILLAFDRFHQRRAHDRELQQVLRRAIGVGPQVECVDLPDAGWQDRADGRPVDPGKRLQHELCRAHERPGVSRAHARVRPPLLHQVDRNAHRRVLLGPDRGAHVLVHADHLRSRDDGEAIARRAAMARNLHLERLGQTNDEQLRVGVRFEEVDAGGNGDRGTVVPAHRIHGDDDLHCGRERRGRRLPRA